MIRPVCGWIGEWGLMAAVVAYPILWLCVKAALDHQDVRLRRKTRDANDHGEGN